MIWYSTLKHSPMGRQHSQIKCNPLQIHGNLTYWDSADSIYQNGYNAFTEECLIQYKQATINYYIQHRLIIHKPDSLLLAIILLHYGNTYTCLREKKKEAGMKIDYPSKNVNLCYPNYLLE